MPEEHTTPERRILVNDVEWPPEMMVDVLEVVVGRYVQGGDYFDITLNNLDSEDQTLKWTDAGELAPGNKLEIRLGYLGELETLMVGEITALRARFPADEPAVLGVQGFDRLHRLRRGRRTRVFNEMKDSQIAEAIAGEMGLTPDVQDSTVVHEYVVQNNLSDVDFLLERSRRIQYEVLVSDQTLTFRPAANALGQSVTVEYMIDLKSFTARLSTIEQTSQTKVRGWNPASKEAILGVAAAGDETGRMDGAATAAELVDSAFGQSVSWITDLPVYSQAEADQIAKARFNDRALDLIAAEAEVVGNPALAAGSTIELRGVGDRYSGVYYVTRAEHRLGPQVGYVTRLSLARNAS